MDSVTPQCLANILWAFATAGPPELLPHLFASCEETVIQNAPKFQGRGLAMVLNAYAKAGLGSEGLWDGLDTELILRLPRNGLRATELAVVSSALSASRATDEVLLEALAAEVERQAPYLRGSSLSNTVQAFVSFPQHVPGVRQVLDILELQDLDARGIATVLWDACRQEGEEDGEAAAGRNTILSSLFELAVGRAAELNLQGVSMVLQAAAACPSLPPTDLLPELEARAMALTDTNAPVTDTKALAGVLSGFVKAGHTPQELFDRLSASATASLSAMNGHSLCSSLWALASAGHPAEDLFLAAEPLVAVKADEFSFEGLAMCAWAYATVGPPNSLAALKALQPAITSAAMANGNKPQELAMTAWASATVGANCSPLLTSINALCRAGDLQLPLQPPHETMLLYACAEAAANEEGCVVPEALLAVLFEELDHAAQGMEARELAICTRSLGALSFRWGGSVPAGLPRALEERIIEAKHSLSSRDLSNILWGSARLDHPSTSRLYGELEPLVTSQAGELSPQGLANCIWAFGHVGWKPSSDFVKATSSAVVVKAAEFLPKEARMTLLGYRRMSQFLPQVEDAFDAAAVLATLDDNLDDSV